MSTSVCTNTGQPDGLAASLCSVTGTVSHLDPRTALARAVLKTLTEKLLTTATSSCLILRG